MSKRKFPKELYVKWEKFADDKPFLIAHEEKEMAAEIGEIVEIAIYTLKGIAKLSTRIEIKEKG